MVFNHSEEVVANISNIINNINVIDLDKLKEEDISLINKNIDDYDTFFTTQQAEFIDYSKFDNHVFFDSAVNKLSYAFNKILNFPYDYDEYSLKQYLNKLEGYTNYIYKNVYPKNKSYVSLNGNQKILVKNKTGALLSDSIEEKIGILNPKNRFSFNFWLRVRSNNFLNNQVVFKFFNLNNNSGYIAFISVQENIYYLNFLIINNNSYSISKTEIKLDNFDNYTINVTNNFNNQRTISFLVNGNNVEYIESDSKVDFLSFDTSLEEIGTSFIIGSSESLVLNIDNSVLEFNNLNGDIDEFRYYHKIKSLKETKREIHKNIFAQNGLIFYLRFNEPGGNYTNSCVCLDSSGNKLHGILLDDDNNIIEDTTFFKVSQDTPMKLEDLNLSPVINSNYEEIKTKINSLKYYAKKYDEKNTNLIFKLMPKHYFLESADQQNLQIFSNDSLIKTNSSLGGSQEANTHFVNIVLIWARFFDQIKIYIDSISTLVDVDYDIINEKKILGIKIPLLCKMYGIEFKEIFSSITKRKQNKEALKFEDVINDYSIRKIQNEIWYKILINSQGILKSKGTINGIEETLSTFGINFSENIQIKEYSKYNDLTEYNKNILSTKIKYLGMSFSNNDILGLESTFLDSSSFSNEKPFIEIENLKSFTDINQPNIDYLIEEDNLSQGLGNNYSIELFYKLVNDKNLNQNITSIQSLFRIDHIKSPVVNVYCKRKNLDSNYFDVIANIKPVINSYSYNVTLTISDVDLLSKENYICLTQKIENDNITFELYCSKANKNLIVETIKKDTQTKKITNIIDENISSNQDNLNLRIGSYYYDNFTDQLFSIDNTEFQGEVLNIRTWSKQLSYNEILNHSRNINNISEFSLSNTSLVNNFYISKNIETQDILLENNINYVLIDNNSISKKLSGESIYDINQCKFSIKSNNNLEDFINYNEFITENMKFDLDNSSNVNRVNILSFENEENKKITGNYNKHPSNSLPYDYENENENRFSLDFSTSKMLNDNISSLIVDLRYFDDILKSNSMYNYNYINLESLQKEYFNRLTDKEYINYSSLGNVFRYLDNILSSMLKDMIPSKIKFKGFNLVYESHILERHKYQYRNSDSRISITNSSDLKNFSREVNKSYRSNSYNLNRRMLKNGNN